MRGGGSTDIQRDRGDGFETCCPEHILEAGRLGPRLLLHSWARNRLVTMWGRRQEIQRTERSPAVKCDKRHLTDRRGKSKSVHSLLITYRETEAEEAGSSLALAPWLSWELSSAFPSSLRSPSATVPAQVLSSACCCPFLSHVGTFF